VVDRSSARYGTRDSPVKRLTSLWSNQRGSIKSTSTFWSAAASSITASAEVWNQTPLYSEQLSRFTTFQQDRYRSFTYLRTYIKLIGEVMAGDELALRKPKASGETATHSSVRQAAGAGGPGRSVRPAFSGTVSSGSLAAKRHSRSGDGAKAGSGSVHHQQRHQPDIRPLPGRDLFRSDVLRLLLVLWEWTPGHEFPPKVGLLTNSQIVAGIVACTCGGGGHDGVDPALLPRFCQYACAPSDRVGYSDPEEKSGRLLPNRRHTHAIWVSIMANLNLNFETDEQATMLAFFFKPAYHSHHHAPTAAAAEGEPQPPGAIPSQSTSAGGWTPTGLGIKIMHLAAHAGLKDIVADVVALYRKWTKKREEGGMTPFSSRRPASKRRLYWNPEWEDLANPVHAADHKGRNALHFAAMGGSTAVVNTLLAEGADLLARTKADETALHVAARADNTEARVPLWRSFASSRASPHALPLAGSLAQLRCTVRLLPRTSAAAATAQPPPPEQGACMQRLLAQLAAAAAPVCHCRPNRLLGTKVEDTDPTAG
jgi:hypothetical protein